MRIIRKATLLYFGLLIMILVLFSVSVSGATSYQDPEHIYTFETDPSSSNAEDQIGTTDSAADTGVALTSGKSGSAWNYTSGAVDWTNGMLDNNATGCISFWFKEDTKVANGYIYANNDGVTPTSAGIRQTGGNYYSRITTQDNVDAQTNAMSDSECPTTTWCSLVSTYDGVRFYVYINGIQRGVVAATGTIDADGDVFSLGSAAKLSHDGNYFDGGIDELYVYENYNCSQSDVTNLQTNFYPLAAAPSEPVRSLNLSWNNPLNNTQFNTPQINFTFAVNVTHYNGLNCSLYQNETLNHTINNIPNNAIQTYIINYTSSIQQSYSYNISCANNETNSSEKRFIFVDNLDPVLSSSLANNLSVGDSTANLSYQMNLTDTFLFLYNTSNIFGYRVNLSFTAGQSFVTYDGSINLTGNAAGFNTLTTTLCDGHTAKTIPNYAHSTQGTKLTYVFGVDWVTIKPKLSNEYSNARTNKQTDRYTFSFERTNDNARARVERYIVTSSQPIQTRGRFSHYEGHIVIPNLGKWVDFANDYGYKATSKIINEYQIEISVFVNDARKDITYRSIGDLNCITQRDQYINAVATQTSVTQSVETDTITYTLNVSLETATSNAVFYYNNTAIGTATKVVGSNYNKYTQTITLPQVLDPGNYSQPFYWAYNITGTNTIKRNTTTQNNIVYRMKITQCNSTTNNLWFGQNFSVQDEVSSAAITINATGTYDVYATPTFKRSEPFNVNSMSSFSACLFPSFASLNADVDFSYSKSSYDERNYVKVGHSINNITELITLQLLQSSASTDVSVVVNDDDDVLLENIRVELYRETSNGSVVYVDSEVTNWKGEVLFQMNLDTKYKFKFYRSNILELDTLAFKVVTTNLFFTLGEGVTSRLADIIKSDSIDRNLTYNNDTSLITWEWNDLSNISQVICLNVTQGNGTFAYGNCSTSSADTMTFLVLQNRTYFATGNMYSNSGNLIVLESIGVDTRTDWRLIGEDGLFFTMFIYLAFVLLGLTKPIAALTFGNVALLMTFFFGFVPYNIVNITGIIILNFIIAFRMKR